MPGFPRATDDFQLVSQPSIARVGGTGTERQVLVGTGLYQMHAYGPGGVEPAGWPKFTGGWTQATPFVGDTDGDGTLEVAALTREGWSFLWETGTDACDGSNEEWWTFHHDEFGSANYGTDARPPGTAEDLALADDGHPELDGAGRRLALRRGRAFEVRASDAPIEAPGDGEVVAESDGAPAPPATMNRPRSPPGPRRRRPCRRRLPRRRRQLGPRSRAIEVPGDVDPGPTSTPDRPRPTARHADRPRAAAAPTPTRRRPGGRPVATAGATTPRPRHPAARRRARNRVEGSSRDDRLAAPRVPTTCARVQGRRHG